MIDSSETEASFDDPEDAFEAFEYLWDRGQIPDLASFARRCPTAGLSATVRELIEIDLERRWRRQQNADMKSLSYYLRLFPNLFSEAEIVDLICSEYAIRNQWGDCISRRNIYKTHSDRGDALLRRLKQTSRELKWPKIVVTEKEERLLEVDFDRMIVAGRQRADEAQPWVIRTTFRQHRLILCAASDTSLSRDQLRLTLRSPQSVLVQNLSTTRALAVRDRRTLAAEERLEFRIPFELHLGGSRLMSVSAK